jgi:cell division septation protein DedD
MQVCGVRVDRAASRVPAGLIRAAALGFALVAATPAHANFQTGAEAYARGDYRTAIAEWEPYAQNDDPRALFNLGQMYRLGIGVDRDLAKAEQYYRRAAELGHVGAQANLGSMLYDRNPPQGQEAVEFWRRAAAGGDPRCQFLVGVQYVSGDFVPRDDVQAYAWLSLAAKAGVNGAQEALATVAKGMRPDAIEAATRLAATLVVPLPARAAAPPTMRATAAVADAAQFDGAVLPHPVEYLRADDLSPISPDAVSGAIPIPYMDETQPPPAPAPSPAPRKPEPAAASEPPDSPPANEAATADSGPEEGPGPHPEHVGDNWRVQVAAGRTEEEARYRWSRLMGSQADLLDAAELYIFKADLGPKGVFYRVQIGGFATRPAAIGLCEKLKARKVECFVTATKP